MGFLDNLRVGSTNPLLDRIVLSLNIIFFGFSLPLILHQKFILPGFLGVFGGG